MNSIDPGGLVKSYHLPSRTLDAELALQTLWGKTAKPAAWLTAYMYTCWPPFESFVLEFVRLLDSTA